jgi:hypothetical protein
MASLDEVRVLLRSEDERTRAVAVRSICPCHGSFDPLRELTPDLRRLAADDPSPRVRREAKHVLGDAVVVNINDERKLERAERQTALHEHDLAKRAAAESRQLRRGRGRRRPQR